MKHLRILGVTLLIFILSACSSTAPKKPEVWLGVTQTSASTNTVRVEFTRTGNKIFGTYRVGNATAPSGSIEGTVENGLITAVLKGSTTCHFDFAGTITETQIEGNYTPNPCPGGSAGTWTLQKQ